MASEVEICNLALTRLGADAIRSFDEDNKRARLSQISYEHTRSLFLEDHEWTFNTKYIQLAQLATVVHPVFSYVYQIPSDCLYARQILDSSGRINSRTKWEVFSNHIATDVEGAWLRYSEEVVVTGRYPYYFVEAIATQIAAELAPAIVQDKTRYDKLVAIASARLAVAKEKDASLGVEYLHRDFDANNDYFVYPPGSEGNADL